MLRWYRVGIVLEREGEPCTWTFHVRAFTEAGALRLVEARLSGEAFAVHALQPSDPLLRATGGEEIVAEHGPWRRSWEDPTVAPLQPLLRP